MAVNIGAVQRLTSPNPFALVSTLRPDGGTNLMALSWWTFVSNHPPMVAVSLSKKGWSGELIAENGEFGLNIVDESLAKAAFSCGTCSGRALDKPTEFGIELCLPEVIKTPLVKESKISMECRLISTSDASDHNLFLAEIVAVRTNEDAKQLYAWEGYKELRPI